MLLLDDQGTNRNSVGALDRPTRSHRMTWRTRARPVGYLARSSPLAWETRATALGAETRSTSWYLDGDDAPAFDAGGFDAGAWG